MPIFLGENHFALFIQDLNYTLPSTHWLHGGIKTQRAKVTFKFGGCRSRANLKIWLKRRLEVPRTVGLSVSGESDDTYVRIISSLFQIVEQMKRDRAQWSAVENVLENTIRAVEAGRDTPLFEP